MENNKNKIFAVIAIGALLILLIGSTFAYFAAQGTDASQTDVNVLTHTVDSLVFETGDALSITADQNTFAMGKGNQTDSTFARATLKANSSTNTAADHYYVYLAIDENTFEYTTTEKTAELILTINKVEGETKTPLTSIKGLNYVTVGEISGFDVTDYNNLVMIANNYEITSNGTKIDEWEVTLTLVNLDSNQSANAGKVFNAQLLIQKEELFAGHIIAQHTEDGTNNLYYHDGVGTYTNADQETGDYSYRYSGGDYTIAPEYQETYKRITKKATTDTDALLGFMCGTTEALPTSTCIDEIQYFYLTYEAAETKTQYVTYKEALNKLIADGYLLDNQVKNYVCFGNNVENCLQDNLYRIIGVINGTAKLIKAYEGVELILGAVPDGNVFPNEIFYKGYLNHIPYYYWSSSSNAVSDWTISKLNLNILNGTYLTTLNTEWANIIANSEWNIGGNTEAKILAQTPSIAYQNEIVNPKENVNGKKITNTKIGLMYVSDYGFAASPENWLTALKSYNNDINRHGNWLYLGIREWTISPYAPVKNYAFFVDYDGDINYKFVGNAGGISNAVRPTFYLNSNVNYIGGTGTSTDPYRIA